MLNNSASHKKALRKNALRPQSQRLALEPRIVFDAALPIAMADFMDAAHAPAEAHVEAPANIDVPADNATNVAKVFANNEASKTAADSKSSAIDSNKTTEATPAERPLIDGMLAPANLTSHEIIFIDAIVADLQTYISDHPNADVVLLDANKDALDQIAAVLSGRNNISTIHILSHGTSGELQIGNGVLNLQNLTSGTHAADLAIIKNALTENGDILIYGCNVAAGDVGQAFIDALAAATSADIAASTDTTGAAEAFGGNWNLEAQTAAIEAKNLQLTDWQGQLVYSNTFSGGAWAISAAANTATTAVSATNTTDGITTTVTLASATANIWSATAVQTLNNIAAFANGAAGTADFTSTFNSANVAGATGTVTITFSKPVLNPIIHIDRIGGVSGTANSSVWTLTTAGATLTKLAGTSSLLVGTSATNSANGATGTTFQRQTGVATAGSESSLTSANGTAAGSMQVAGTYTTLTFNVIGPADGLELAFAFDAPPVTSNDAFTTNEDATLTGNLFANNGSGADTPFADAVKINTINGATFTVGTPITLSNGVLTITNATTGDFTFVPNANYNGLQTFTYDVVEVNNAGTPLPGTGVGNISNTSTATITINSVNDAPAGTDKTITTVTEESPYTVTAGDFGFSDLNDTPANAFTNVIVTSLPAATEGVYKLSGAAITANQVITVADINAGKLIFTPALNQNGVLGALGFKVQDIGGTANGGIDTDPTANILNFNIVAVNDAPTGANKTININEDTAYTVTTADFGFSDPNDTPANTFASVIINVRPPATDGVYTLNGVAISDNQVISVADINSGLLKFTPATDKIGTSLGALSFQVKDNGGTANGGADTSTAKTLQFNIANVNDAPSGANSTININEDTPYTVTAADFSFTDPIDTPANTLANVIVTSRPPATDGIYTLNGVAIFTGQVIAVADINAGLLKFVPATNKNGTTIGALGFKVQDNGGVLNGGVDTDPTANVLNFNITAVNDAPTVSLPANGVLSTIEDTALILNAITIADVDATTGSESVTITIGAGQGILNWTTTPFVGVTNNGTGSITLSGQINAIRNAITTGNALTYVPTADFNGTAALTVTINDNGNTGTGPAGGLSATATTNITVTAVKDTVADNLTTAEDTPITFNVLTGLVTAGTGTYNSPGADNFEGAPSVTSITQPTAGTGTATLNNATGSITFTPAVDFHGTTTFTYTVTSPAGVIETETITITVLDVNDAPTAQDKTVTINEDTPYTVTAADFVFADAKDTPANAFSNVIIGASLPPATDGVYTLNGVAISANQVISVADINAGLLKFTPAADKNGDALGALSFKVQDNGGTLNGGLDTSTAKTLQFNITPVADIVTIGGLNNGTVSGTDAQVKESDLSTGTTPAGTGEVTTGTFNLGPDSALASVLIDGGGAGNSNLTKAQLAAVAPGSPITIIGTNGTLNITGYNAATGVVSYTYTLTIAANHTAGNVNDAFSIAATSIDGNIANGSLAIDILDDAPIAIADTDEAINKSGNPSSTASGNVFTGVGGTDPNNADGNKDNLGADVVLNPITGVIAGFGAPVAGNIGALLAGAYGSVTLNADGSYVYTPNYANPTVAGLTPGQSVTDTFTYQISDADGDTATTTLKINIVGVPAIIGLGDGAVAGTDGSVLESDLDTIGTNGAGNGEVLNGSFQLASPAFGVNTLTIAGTTLSTAQLANAATFPITITTPNGTLVINNYVPDAVYIGSGPISGGSVNYTYTLITPPTTAAAVTDDFAVSFLDGVGNNSGVSTLKIAIIDDAPIATNDVASISENTASTPTLTVFTNDKIGADGSAVANSPVTGLVVGTGSVASANVGAPLAGNYGSITLLANGNYTYTLDNNNLTVNALKVGQTLTETYSYKITDKDGDFATATLTITINGANDAPVANDNTYNMSEDGAAITLTPLAGDTDVDGDTLSITNIAGTPIVAGTAYTITVSGGVVNVSAGGAVTFTPNANFNGAATFAYTISDGTTTSTANQIINVAAVNDAPIANPNTNSIAEDAPAGATGNVITDNNGAGVDSDLDTGNSTGLTVTQFTIAGVPGSFAAGATATIAAGTIKINADGSYVFTPALNFNGNVPQITYTVSDNTGAPNQTATSTLDINVTPANDAPTAVNDTKIVPEDTTASGNVLANDNDVDTGTNVGLTVTQYSIAGVAGSFAAGTTQTIAGKGDITINSDGSYTFVPVANFNGAVPQITYTVSDNDPTTPLTTTANLDIALTPVNDAPVAVDDNFTTNEDTPIVLDLLATGVDTDVDTSDILSIKSINNVLLTPGTAQTIAVPNGQVLISTTGVITFKPNANYNGSSTFDYVLQDGQGGEDTGTVNITVNAVNDAPIAKPDTDFTLEDTPTSGNVLTNDTDVDTGTTLTVTAATVDLNGDGVQDLLPIGTPTLIKDNGGNDIGTITLNSDGTYTFSPALNFNGSVPQITYTANDGSGAVNATASSTLNISVGSENDPPIATPKSVTLNEDAPTAPVSLKGADVDGTIASVSITTLPLATQGVLYYPDGTTPVPPGAILSPADAANLVFKPAANFNGAVVIPFTVLDNDGATSAPANFTINVTAVNDPPVATPVAVTAPEDSSTIPVNLSGTDIEDGVPNIVRVTTLPPAAQGILYLADGITPVTANTPLTALEAAGLIFKPAPNFNGTVSIPFTVTDSNGATSPPANAVITITPVNDNPVAVDDNYSMAEDGAPITLTPLTGDSDVDGNTLTITEINGVARTPGAAQSIPVTGGTVNVSAAGVISFTPNPNFNGVVTVPYTISDGNGGAATAKEIINVTAVNDPPVATPVAVTAPEDSSTIPVNLGGTDIEDGVPNIVRVTTLPPAAQGILYLADGITPVTANTPLTALEAAGLIFKPAPNFNGTVSIPFTVTDSNGATSPPANAVITITPVNDNPVAVDDNYSMAEDGAPITLTPLTGDSDVDGNTLTITEINGVARTPGAAQSIPVTGGTVNVSAAGVISFTPNPNFNGVVTVPYTISDGNGGAATAKEIINVTAVNDPPVATPTSVSANEDNPVTLNLLGTDIEDPTSALITTVTTLPLASQGILYLADGLTPVAAGSPLTAAEAAGLVFKPAPNFNGTVNIPFRVTDTNGAVSPVITATITIIAVNDPPVAISGSANTPDNTPVTVILKGIDVDGAIASVKVTQLPLAAEGILYYQGGTVPVLLTDPPMTPAQAQNLVFKPNPAYVSTATDIVDIKFTVKDNLGLDSAPASFVIDVSFENNDPIATASSAITPEDTPVVISLNGTDSDPGDSVVSVSITALPPVNQGILYLSDGTTPVQIGLDYPPGSFVFVPAPNFSGNITPIGFTVKDSLGQVSSPPTVANINVGSVNDAPVAAPDAQTVNEDTSATGNVLSNDTDVDSTGLKVTQFVVNGTTVTVTPASPGTTLIPGVGTITINSSGVYTFVPIANFNGAVPVITYTVDDGSGTATATDTSTLTLTVSPVNDPPVATPITATGNEDDPFIALGLVGSDVDNAAADLVTTVPNLPPAAQGRLVFADGTPVIAGTPYSNALAAGIRFVPAPNFSGTVNIPFVVKDPSGASSTATAVVRVLAVNDAPVAASASYNTNEDTPTNFSISATDTEGPVVSYTITNVPPASQGVIYLSNGTTVVNAGDVITPAQAASLIFKPALNYFGAASLSFSAKDNDATTPLNSNVATITFNIADVVTPPIATPVNVSGTADKQIPLALTGTDADGTVTGVVVQTLPPASQGVLLKADGTPVVAGVTLTPAEAAGLTFKPATSFNGTVNIPFFVIDDEGNISATSSATTKVTDTSILFEQLLPKNNLLEVENGRLRLPHAFTSIGMPEDLFVANSVRESQNQIAQNSALGLFNVDTPTANELNNFTFDLKGAPRGMDPNLFVQNAVRGAAVTFEPSLFVQNAVRQAELESTARNIGVNSFNSATPGVSDLFSPFEIGSAFGSGSPLSFNLGEVAPPVADLSPIKSTNRDIVFKNATVDKQKANKECIPLKMQTRDYTQTHAHKPYLLKAKPAAERLQPASSFTKQLTHAKHKSSTNVFCKH